MADEQDKGFRITDRRAGRGDEDAGVTPSPEPVGPEDATPAPDLPAEEATAPPLSGEPATGEEVPRADFLSLVVHLWQLGLISLGQIADPSGQPVPPDLVTSRQIIGLLEILQEKTRGNLTEEEVRFTAERLADLQYRFVKVSGSAT